MLSGGEPSVSVIFIIRHECIRSVTIVLINCKLQDIREKNGLFPVGYRQGEHKPRDAARAFDVYVLVVVIEPGLAYACGVGKPM